LAGFQATFGAVALGLAVVLVVSLCNKRTWRLGA
jgi:hypothetical protein